MLGVTSPPGWESQPGLHPGTEVHRVRLTGEVWLAGAQGGRAGGGEGQEGTRGGVRQDREKSTAAGHLVPQEVLFVWL